MIKLLRIRIVRILSNFFMENGLENKRLFGLVCRLQRQMNRDNGNLFSEFGVSPVQLDLIIFVLFQRKKGVKVCQKDIEKHLNLRPSSVSSLLSTLEKKELIVRSVSAGDARTKYVSLTPKGETLCEKHKILMDKCDAAIQSALSEEEQENFKLLIEKIIDGIKNTALKGEDKL